MLSINNVINEHIELTDIFIHEFIIKHYNSKFSSTMHYEQTLFALYFYDTHKYFEVKNVEFNIASVLEKYFEDFDFEVIFENKRIYIKINKDDALLFKLKYNYV